MHPRIPTIVGRPKCTGTPASSTCRGPSHRSLCMLANWCGRSGRSSFSCIEASCRCIRIRPRRPAQGLRSSPAGTTSWTSGPRSTPRMRHPAPEPPRTFHGCGWAVSEPHHSEPNVRCMYRIHFAPADACGIRCSMPPGPPPRKRHTRQRPRPLLFRCMRRHFQAFWFSSGPAALWSSTRAFWVGFGLLAVAGPIRTVIWLGQRAQAPFPIHSYMGYGLAGMGTLSARALHRLCLRQILCRARSMRNPSFGPPGRLATSQLQFQTGSPEGEP